MGSRLETTKGWEEKICMHPEHNPPTHILIPIGKELHHVCPACDREQIIKSPMGLK